MSMLRMLAAGGATPPVTAIEDVFAAVTRTGTGAIATVTTGFQSDLVWSKIRSSAYPHGLFDSINGATNFLRTDGTNGILTDADSLTAFTSTGYTLGTDPTNQRINVAGGTYVNWCWKQAAKFFKVAQVVVSGSNQTVDLSSLGTVGMVTVKRTDSTSAWYTLHRSNTAGKLCYLNTTAAETTDGSITLSGTTLTLVQSVIGNGTFIVYAWAHDTSANGLIQCGSFLDSDASIPLGWESQYFFAINLTNGGTKLVVDTARGWPVGAVANKLALGIGASSAEAANYYPYPAATGLPVVGMAAGKYAFMAIRRGPMKLPTVGTQVYNAIARTGTGAAATVTGVGFPPDFLISTDRGKIVLNYTSITDRLRGASAAGTPFLFTGTTQVENNTSSYFDALLSFDMDGLHLGPDFLQFINRNASTYINHFFRRYPGVFDEVCFTSVSTTNQRIAHNLTVVPELIITKSRSGTTQWFTYSATATPLNYYLALENTQATTANGPAIWGSSAPTATDFGMNNSGTGTVYGTGTIVAYLFATLAGISKVGSYTGNGSSLTLNMGFSAGARFFMCKRTDSTGDWFVWDSTRGINGASANDPHLSLNATAAEVNTTSDVEPYTTGITVVENATTHINVNAATYIYLSFS